MSITVDFAFNAPGDLTDVRKMVNAALGVDLQPYEEDTDDLFCRLLGLELSLGVCDLVDDRDLNFTRYGFLLSTRTPAPDGDLMVYQVEVTALAAHALLLRGMVREGILAYDVQTLIARYTIGSDGGVEDELSRGPVRFPEHLAALRARSIRK